jgi:hypothetical protein
MILINLNLSSNVDCALEGESIIKRCPFALTLTRGLSNTEGVPRLIELSVVLWLYYALYCAAITLFEVFSRELRCCYYCAIRIEAEPVAERVLELPAVVALACAEACSEY